MREGKRKRRNAPARQPKPRQCYAPAWIRYRLSILALSHDILEGCCAYGTTEAHTLRINIQLSETREARPAFRRRFHV